MRQTAIAFNLLLALMLLTTCGADQREQTLKATLVAVNRTRDSFIELDAKAQIAIVNAAPSHDAGVAMLAAYRAKREIVIQAFEATYRAIAIAATISSDPKSIATMLSAAAQLDALIKDLKGAP